LFCIVFLVENNFTSKGAPPSHSSYTRNHHNAFPKWNLKSFVIDDAIELPLDEFYHLKDNDERILRMIILIKKN